MKNELGLLSNEDLIIKIYDLQSKLENYEIAFTWLFNIKAINLPLDKIAEDTTEMLALEHIIELYKQRKFYEDKNRTV